MKPNGPWRGRVAAADRRRRAGLVAAIALAAVVLAGCGGDDEPVLLPSPTPSPTTASPSPTPTPEPVWPLTGLPAPDAAARPALVVKIDNTRSAAPQLGLSSADLVVEELVEGGLTRLAVLFQSTLPEAAGPVRSVRTTDAGIALPAGGVLVASGGAGRVLRALDEAGVLVLAEGSDGMSRDGGRRAPYNVMLDPAEALAGLPAGAGVPTGPYLPWGAPVTGRPVTGADVTFSGTHTSRWTWSDGVWELDGDRAADGDEFGPATVLVLRVVLRDAGYTDPAGNPVPESVLTGEGAATLLTGGAAVEGRWSKASLAAPLVLTDTRGAPLHVPPGRVWIELVPEAGSVQLR